MLNNQNYVKTFRYTDEEFVFSLSSHDLVVQNRLLLQTQSPPLIFVYSVLYVASFICPMHLYLCSENRCSVAVERSNLLEPGKVHLLTFTSPFQVRFFVFI